MLLTRRASGDVERARTLLFEGIADARRLALPWRLRLYDGMLREAGA